MGLDHYISKKIYIGAEYEHNKITGIVDIKRNGISLPIDLSKIDYVTEAFLTWRKVNAIHKFFVDTIQDGEDDCKNYYLPKEVLKEFMVLIKEDIEYLRSCELDANKKYIVDEDKINLKTQSGFFFGSTDYYEYYVEELEEALQILEQEDFNDDAIEYEYGSSW